MKKGLSVLLILAALFGFYGGATNLNDVLDCKEYWEEKGKQTTADLNKLEDGINQLKDNEQAYLDGQGALAEGEKSLADGEAQYAQGLKDYAAAPGKLAEGREGLEKLRAAIKGINDLKAVDGYPKWKKGYNSLKDGRKQIYDGAKPTKASLDALAAFLPPSDQKAYLAAVKDVAADDEKQWAKDYKNFINSTNALEKYIPVIQATVAKLLDVATGYDGETNFEACKYVNENKTYLDKLASLLPEAKQGQYSNAVAGCNGAYKAWESAPDAAKELYEEAINAAQGDFAGLAAAVPGLFNGYAGENTGALWLIANGPDGKSGLKAVNTQVNGDSSPLKIKLLPGLKKFNSQATIDAVNQLYDGQNKTIAPGVKKLVSGILGDKIMKKAMIKKVGRSKVNKMKKYGKKKSPLYAKNGCDFAEFEKRMDKSPDVMTFLKNALPIVKARLAQGKKDYAKGLADYKAAPGKLADAEQQLADGRKQLADGKAKLAEYEDGEQQVRDGLATVMGSEANGGLDSILDRRNGDDDFDNGDKHLELDEGLSAVDTARGYQADSGELITKEIMTRAIGTGLSLAAAALACLAALLGLLKKYKGAGVAALLAAAAGCVGIYQGVSAGSEFSSIAGSTVGNMPWIAAGVLAGVAALHAITHFAAKKDA